DAVPRGSDQHDSSGPRGHGQGRVEACEQKRRQSLASITHGLLKLSRQPALLYPAAPVPFLPDRPGRGSAGDRCTASHRRTLHSSKSRRGPRSQATRSPSRRPGSFVLLSSIGSLRLVSISASARSLTQPVGGPNGTHLLAPWISEV